MTDGKTQPRQRDWTAPNVRQVADLARIVATSVGGGKTPGPADGASHEAMAMTN